MKVSLWWVVAAPAIVLGSFFGTLFYIDNFTIDGRNAIRAEESKAIRAALEKYKAARGSFPAICTGSVNDLEPSLVAGGFISKIPQDPLKQSKGQNYGYCSGDGTVYAVLVLLESANGNKQCLVGTRGYGYWSDPPACPF